MEHTQNMAESTFGQQQRLGETGAPTPSAEHVSDEIHRSANDAESGILHKPSLTSSLNAERSSGEQSLPDVALSHSEMQNSGSVAGSVLETALRRDDSWANQNTPSSVKTEHMSNAANVSRLEQPSRTTSGTSQALDTETKEGRSSPTYRLPYTPTHSQNHPSASASVVTTPEQPSSLTRDNATDPGNAPSQAIANSRPTSRPNDHSTSLSRRRDPPAYPHYPDQSFAALQAHHPPIPHSLRSRASNMVQRHSPSSNSSKSNSVTDLPHIPSGAKTTSNTPAQSPGLFSPTFPSRNPRSDSEDGHYTTPKLHPTHIGAPKETTKLAKDYNPVTNRKQFNNYEVLKQLGSGQHGKVKLGINLENNEKVAIKIVRRFSKKLRLGKTGNPDDAVKKEVAILKKARHPHVVSLYEVIDDDEFEKVYLVLEFVEKGEIVWQKPTEKSIGMFEKDRLEREMTGNYDESHERAAIEEYNSHVPARREEKAIKIKEHLEARRLDEQHLPGYQSSERRPSLADPYWSLEYGGDSENEYAETSPEQNYFGADTRMSRADIHAAETAQRSPRSATPSHTPRSHPYPSNIDHPSTSQPASRPDTPHMLQGSIYEAYSERGSSVPDLDLNLTQLLAFDSEWSEDDSNYQFQKVPCLTLNQTLDAFRDTVLGLEYLHYQGIMHRDIKPANLLWTSDYRVKISDFGVSYLRKPLREDGEHAELPEADVGNLDEDIELAKTVGTPAFYAPELCDPDLFDVAKQTVKPAITNLIDVWALGVTLYGMIYGRLPFFDDNHYKMFQKISKDELFISKYRLKGVSHTDKTPSNHNKRMDDVLEYEEVEDTLQDLLRRLLAKDPAQRITLKEVKHHPWVISGIEDRDEWLDQTDPGVQSQGKKIEPSNEEVQDAVVGLTLFDRLKTEVKRMTSVLRGSREPRKRTDSNPKPPSSATVASAAESSAASPNAKDERRTSLRGDEQIYSALRASREPAEHPLAQSVAASPNLQQHTHYFPNDAPPSSLGQPLQDDGLADRSTAADRALSTADSVQTIRPPRGQEQKREPLPTPSTSSDAAAFSTTMPFVESQISATSNVGSLFGDPGRLMNNMRSYERGNLSQSSRSSSIDASRNREELHAAPSLAMSSAIAAGHVDQPPALRDDAEVGIPEQALPQADPASTGIFADQVWHRQDVESLRSGAHGRSISQQVSNVASPTSPDDLLFYSQQRPASVADSSSGFPAMSSSSDMIVSGESAVHSRIPSVVSGASSLSAAPEDEAGTRHTLEKSSSPLPMAHGKERPQSMYTSTTIPVSHPTLAQAKVNIEEEAGYNGEPEEEDSSSEDEGIVMG